MSLSEGIINRPPFCGLHLAVNGLCVTAERRAEKEKGGFRLPSPKPVKKKNCQLEFGV